MKQYKVPAKFWDDHCDRMPCDGDPDECMAHEVSRSGSRVVIEGTPEQIECLRMDAAFYCSKWGPDRLPPGLKTSAAATLKVLTEPRSKD